MHTHIARETLARLVAASALVALAALVAVGIARGATPSAYTDPAGDSGSAPDIQAVTLIDDGAGHLGFAIDLAATIPNDGSMVVVLVDADRNGATGSEGGSEYGVIANSVGVGLVKWDGTQWSQFDHSDLEPRLDGGHLTFTLSLGDLGVTSFDFVVGGVHGDDVDAAPDNGVYTYAPAPAPVPGPAAVQPEAAVPTVKSVLVTGSFAAKAGKTFSVPAPRLRLSDDQLVVADSYSCTLKDHGKALKPLRKCTWTLPKATKGKTLTLKLVVAYQGESRTATFPVVPG